MSELTERDLNMYDLGRVDENCMLIELGVRPVAGVTVRRANLDACLVEIVQRRMLSYHVEHLNDSHSEITISTSPYMLKALKFVGELEADEVRDVLAGLLYGYSVKQIDAFCRQSYGVECEDEEDE